MLVSPRGAYTDEYKRLTNQFIASLILCKQETTNGLEGNELFKFLKHKSVKDYPNLQIPFYLKMIKKDIYYLKDISVSEYRKIAKQYILSFFKTISSQDFLILDAILSDEWKPERHEKIYNVLREYCYEPIN